MRFLRVCRNTSVHTRMPSSSRHTPDPQHPPPLSQSPIQLREAPLDMLVLKACRSLRFLHPSDASRALMAISELAVTLPVQPVTLLTWVAPRFCDYGFDDMARTFEAVSRLGLSHHLMTAHFLKTLLRSLLALLQSRNAEKHEGVLTLPLETHVLPCVCSVVFTLQRWHTRHTLRSFLVALEATLGPILVDTGTQKRDMHSGAPADATGSRDSENGMLLFLFEVYVQCDVLASLVSGPHVSPLSEASGHICERLPVLTSLLRSALPTLKTSEVQRVLFVLQRACDLHLIQYQATVSSPHDALSRLLNLGAATPPVPHEVSRLMPRERSRIPIDVLLVSRCAHLRRVLEGPVLSEEHVVRLMGETQDLLEQSRHTAHAALDDDHPDDHSTASPSSEAVLLVMLPLARHVCGMRGDGDEAWTAVQSAARLWVETAMPFLVGRLREWKHTLQARCGALSWCNNPSNMRIVCAELAQLAHDWQLLLAAVDLCDVLARDASVMVPADVRLLQEVCGATRWLLHSHYMLKQDLLSTVSTSAAVRDLQRHGVTAVLALLYYTKAGALVTRDSAHNTPVVGHALEQLRSEIRIACRALLPFHAQLIEAVVTAPDSATRTWYDVGGWGVLANQSLEGAASPCYSLSNLSATMAHSIALCAHVTLYLADVVDMCVAPSSAESWLFAPRATPHRLETTLLLLFTHHHSSLAHAVRGALYMWSRRLFTNAPAGLLLSSFSGLESGEEWPPRATNVTHLSAGHFTGWDAHGTLRPRHGKHSMRCCVNTAGAAPADLLQDGGATLTQPFHPPCVRIRAEVDHILHHGVCALLADDVGVDDRTEPLLFYLRFLAWHCATAYDALLPALQRGTRTTRLACISPNAVREFHDALIVACTRLAFFHRVAKELEDMDSCSRHDQHQHHDECQLLVTAVNAAVVPVFVLQMLQQQAAMAQPASPEAPLDACQFVTHLAQLVRLPRRHLCLFMALLDTIEATAPTHIQARITDWSEGVRRAWGASSQSAMASLPPRQLVALVVQSCHTYGQHRFGFSVPGEEIATCTTTTTGDGEHLRAFLAMLEVDFPLIHMWRHGRFHYLSGSELVRAVTSTFGLLVLLDLVALVDPPFMSAQLTGEATSVRAFCDCLGRVHNQFAQLRDDLSPTAASESSISFEHVADFPLIQVSFLLALANGTNTIVTAVLFDTS